MYELLFNIGTTVLNIQPEALQSATGTLFGVYLRWCFKDPTFFITIMIAYTFIFHSDYLRRKKVLEYTGLGIFAVIIAVSLLGGLTLISRS